MKVDQANVGPLETRRDRVEELGLLLIFRSRERNRGISGGPGSAPTVESRGDSFSRPHAIQVARDESLPEIERS